MAAVAHQTNNKGIIFTRDVTREFVRGNQLSGYMSNDGMNVISVRQETGKIGGDQINLPLILALRGAAVGVGTLTGNEESIGNYGCRFWIDWARKAVKINKAETKKGSFDIYSYARPLVSEWGRNLQRDELVLALASIPSESPPAGLGSDAGQRVNGIPWASATAAQKNTWMDANSDRVLFGSAVGNYSAGSFATSVANVDATADKASAKIVRMLKTIAMKTDPRISPLTTDDGYERYVLFVGPNAFRDLQADAEIYAANKDARPREGNFYKKNPIFNDGDLLYNGTVIRCVPEIDKLLTLTAVGASSINVAPMFFCGKSALGMVWGQLPQPNELDDTDYGFWTGLGTDMCYGVGKVFYKTDAAALKDWGLVTAFVASVDDA